MKNLFRFRNILVAVGLIASQGCKSETARKADKAADRVLDKQADLRDEEKDVADKKVDEVEESKDVAKEASELAEAQSDFETRRAIRMNELRATHAVIASQPLLINTMAENFGLTDKGRTDVIDKLTVFQMRLDEAGNMIEGLQSATAADWKDRNDKASEAMERLDDARKDAWDTLEDADRLDNAST